MVAEGEESAVESELNVRHSENRLADVLVGVERVYDV